MELARSATKGRHGPRASMWNKVVLWCQRSCQDVLGAGSAFSLGTSRGRWPVVAPSGTPPYRKTIAYSCSGWATGCRARAQSPARLFFFFLLASHCRTAGTSDRLRDLASANCAAALLLPPPEPASVVAWPCFSRDAALLYFLFPCPLSMRAARFIDLSRLARNRNACDAYCFSPLLLRMGSYGDQGLHFCGFVPLAGDTRYGAW